MKKLRILGEKQNVPDKVIESPNLTTIKETMAPPTTPTTPAQQQKATNDAAQEPLLEENPNQYVIFPIAHADMWAMYKHLVDNFWSVTETGQQFQVLQLKYNDVQFMKYFTSIFASPHSRGLVNDNFAEDFCKLIQVTEAKFFYGHQLFVQNIHFEMYNQMLDKFVPTQEEK
jgi:ribonucleotide reductase beta subunit family protein with ferritin-like domain